MIQSFKILNFYFKTNLVDSLLSKITTVFGAFHHVKRAFSKGAFNQVKDQMLKWSSGLILLSAKKELQQACSLEKSGWNKTAANIHRILFGLTVTARLEIKWPFDELPDGICDELKYKPEDD